MTANALIANQKLGRSRAASSNIASLLATGTAASGIPTEEQWLYRAANKVALELVRDGIEDLRRGRIRQLAPFADIDNG